MSGWWHARSLGLALALALAATACGFRAGYEERDIVLCATERDCPDGEVCRADVCALALDAGAAAIDAEPGADAPVDADPLAFDAEPLFLDASALPDAAVDAVTGASERDGGRDWPGCPRCGGGFP